MKRARCWFCPALFAALLVGGLARAYEMRTWTSADGKTIEAELLSCDGDEVTIKNKAGDRFTFKKSRLSQADLLYLKEKVPSSADDGPGARNKPHPKVANPAKEATIDRKAFKDGKDFITPQGSFKVLETPHFKIMYSKGAKPDDLAELAERMWFDATFHYPTLAQKFGELKQAIFLVDDEATYKQIGEWYANLLDEAKAFEAANSVRTTWKQAAAGVIAMPDSIAAPNEILPRARVFRTYEPNASPGEKRPEKLRGVWVPFRVHCIASDLLDVQIGGLQSSAFRGSYALSTGYAYHKEIFLTGVSETSILSAQSVADTKTTGGFKSDAKTWPDELRKLIRKGELKPGINALYETEANNSTAATNVLAYSFAQFLHSAPERLAGWCALVERMSTSHQVPAAEDMAKVLGFADAATMEKEWLEFVSSSKFK